jgi:hypothetical protein
MRSGMSTNPRLDLAFEILRAKGHEIGAKGTARISLTGVTLILVDGVYRTELEVLEMADWPDIP